MPTYAYSAYTETGRRRQGRIEAAGTSAAEESLWRDGLKIVSLVTAPPQKTFADYFPTFFRVTSADLVLFTRQLATFVAAGVPMSRGLATIAEETPSRQLRRVIFSILKDLEGGQNLSEVLARHPAVFPPLYVDLIRVAELTGNLEETLKQLGGYLRRDISATRRLQAAMVYPSVVLAVAVVVVIILAVYALPAFVRIFAEFNVPLPLSTRILIAITKFINRWGLAMAGVLAALGMGVLLALRTQPGAFVKDLILLRTPGLGPIVLAAVMTRFARTLAIVLKAGVPLARTFDAVIRATGNRVFRRGLESVREQMTGGEGFAGPLSRTKLFPPMITQMVRVGEETGTLDVYLEQAAEFYDEELEHRIRQMTAMIEPAMTVGVGLVVGFVAVSLISAMYGLVGALK